MATVAILVHSDRRLCTGDVYTPKWLPLPITIILALFSWQLQHYCEVILVCQNIIQRGHKAGDLHESSKYVRAPL